MMQYILEDDLDSFKFEIKRQQPKSLIDDQIKPFQNFQSLNILEYAVALGKLDFIKVIYAHLGSWDYQTKNKKFLDYQTLETTLQILDLLSMEKFEMEQKWSEDEFQSNEFEGDFEEGDWEDNDNNEEQGFDKVIESLNLLLKLEIMKAPRVNNSPLILLATTIKLFDEEFQILKMLLPYYNQDLRTEYQFQGQTKSLMHLAIQVPSIKLFTFLIGAGYQLLDFSVTQFNPIYEIWKQLTIAETKKSGSENIYRQLFNLVHSGNRIAYNRAGLEFYLIIREEFTFEDAVALNKLSFVTSISNFRGENNQTLLSIVKTPEIAEAVLFISGINPMQPVPLENGIVGIALQRVPIDVIPIILKEMQYEDILNILPWFLETRQMQKFNVVASHLYLENSEEKYLSSDNLRNLGLTNGEIQELNQLIEFQSSREECSICGELTEQKLECGHFAHYECLVKMQGNQCAYCRVPFILPEPYQKEKDKIRKAEKREAERKWREGYNRLLETYGENIPESELYKLTVETGI